MWQMLLSRREMVALVVDQHRLSCARIRHRTNVFPLELVGYQTTPLPPGAVTASKIFNPTLLRDSICSFAGQAVRGTRLAISLCPPLACQSMRKCAHANPALLCAAPDGACGCDQQSCYLYPDNAGKFVFYSCGVPYILRVQWQLIAQQVGMPLTVLTADQMALLGLYQAMYGRAFRQSQLALHMAQAGGIDRVFTIDSLARLLYVPGRLHVDRCRELHPLLTACGLFLFEESDEAT